MHVLMRVVSGGWAVRLVRSSDHCRWNFVASGGDVVPPHGTGRQTLGLGAKVRDYQLYRRVSASPSGPVGRNHTSPVFDLHVGWEWCNPAPEYPKHIST